ncbi:Protein of unknown function (DUF3078) [Cyclonatronum proteinivorum]|uniref:DUF3078 domain-containing protein n=1 Tax=Cyclonatronum proteinivorum TaxID=1457365 RepID=A0A345UM53_9BACT|nr:DUF3078 domain-containing protein [Cyclonatronum proteinivorum]AXJ01555.1 Protein of unknown function (DUF3078) [Cyclonatronum proteinivorum]
MIKYRAVLLITLFISLCASVPFSYASLGAGGVEWGTVPADTVSPWTLEFRGQLNGSQASFRNWEQGGVNTVALTASTNFNALYRRGNWGYNLDTRLVYGQAKVDDDFRKTEDEIKIRNSFRYFLEDDRWSVVGSVNFISQFDEGLDRSREFAVSKFMAPAYLTETIGISFSPTSSLSAEFGASARQTFVLTSDSTGAANVRTTFRERYGLRADQSVKNELGFSLLVRYDKEILENVRYIGSIETFSNASQRPDRSDFTFNNELIGRINNYLNTTFRFTMLYNEDVSKKLQLRQTFSVGLSVRFI